MKFVRSHLPYFSFLFLFTVSLLFLLAASSWEKNVHADQNNHFDAQTGTWKSDYDWRGLNDTIELLRKVRLALLGILLVHSLVDSVYAIFVKRGWSGFFLGLVFAMLAFFFFMILVWGSAGCAGMIGFTGERSATPLNSA